MTQQVLIETYTPEQAKFVIEAVNDGNGKKNWYLEGVCMQAEVKNRNGRRYPLKEIASAVEQLQTGIQANQCYGELDHPDDSRVTLKLANVSHMFEKLEMRGNDAVGRLKLFETPMGMIAIKILEGGGRVGVSTRGTGDVMEGGDVAGFKCSCIDLVTLPSAPNAMPDPIYEALQHDRSGREVITLAESVLQDATAQAFFERAITQWISSVLNRQ